MKKIIYSLVIMIAAGSLFTSCVNYDEPKGVQDLREAKASYLDALSGLRAADAALVNAKAEVEKANAAYRNAEAALMNAKVEYQKLLNEAQETANAEALAKAQKNIADYENAAAEAAKAHEYAMAEWAKAISDLQKKIEAEALCLTEAEANVLKNIVDNYNTALDKYNKAADKVAEKKKDLYDAEHGVEHGKDWTIEDRVAVLEENIEWAEYWIEYYQSIKDAIDADPDVQAWAANLESLEAEMVQCEYDWNKKYAEAEILKAKDLPAGVEEAKAAMEAWVAENWVDPFTPEQVEFEINIPATLQALVPSVLAYFAGETPSSTIPGQTAFTITMAKYLAELLLDEEGIKKAINLIMSGDWSAPQLDASTLATAAQYIAAIAEEGLLFDFEISPDFTTIKVSGTTDDFDEFINGDKLMNVKNLLSGWNFNVSQSPLPFQYQAAAVGAYAVYSMITVKNIGLKGILNIIEENDLLAPADDTTATNAYKKNYEYLKAQYEADLDTLDKGFEAYAAADQKLQKAIAKKDSTAAAKKAADDTVVIFTTALQNAVTADSLKAVAMVKAFNSMNNAGKAIKDEGVDTRSYYSSADARNLLDSIKAFVSARAALVGNHSTDSIKYLKANFVGMSISSVEKVSKAIVDLTFENDLLQVVDSVMVESGYIYYKVSNKYTLVSEDIMGGVQYKSADYVVAYRTQTTAGDQGWTAKANVADGTLLAQAIFNDGNKELTKAALSSPMDPSYTKDPISYVFEALGVNKPFWSLSTITYQDIAFYADNQKYTGGGIGFATDPSYKYKLCDYESVFFPWKSAPVAKAEKDLAAKVVKAQKATEADDAAGQELLIAETNTINKFWNVYNKFFGLNNNDTKQPRYVNPVDTHTVALFLADKDASKKAKAYADTLANEIADMKYFAANASNFMNVDLFTGIVEARVGLEVAVAMGNFKTIQPNFVTDAYQVLWFACGDVVNEIYDNVTNTYDVTRGYPTASEFLQMSIAKHLYEIIANGKTTQQMFDTLKGVCATIEAKTSAIAEQNTAAKAEYENFLTELFGINYCATAWYNEFADEYGLDHTTIYNAPYYFNTKWILKGYRPVGGKALEFYNEFVKETVDTIETLEREVANLHALYLSDQILYTKINHAYGEALEAVTMDLPDPTMFTKAYDQVMNYLDECINDEQDAILNFKWELDRIAAGVDHNTIKVEKAKRELAEAEAKLAVAEEILAMVKAEYEAAMAKFSK